MSSRGIHILAMEETWLKPDISDGEVHIHYRLFRKDRVHRQGGGVGIFCHESLVVRRRTDLESDLEVLWLEVMCNGGPVLIGCVYRPPNQPPTYWNDF